PSATNSFTDAFAMPEPAPVTTATLPSNSPNATPLSGAGAPRRIRGRSLPRNPAARNRAGAGDVLDERGLRGVRVVGHGVGGVRREGDGLPIGADGTRDGGREPAVVLFERRGAVGLDADLVPGTGLAVDPDRHDVVHARRGRDRVAAVAVEDDVPAVVG